jgi:hypothetical protein
MEEKFIVEDESNDKKYFSMLPNYILNHSSAIDQSLYWNIKRHAGENGTFSVSKRTLMKKMAIGYKALTASFDYLLSHNWIKSAGFKEIKTNSGKQKIEIFKIVDIWKENVSFYKQRGVPESNHLRCSPKDRCSPKEARGVPESNTKKNKIKEELTDTNVSVQNEKKDSDLEVKKEKLSSLAKSMPFAKEVQDLMNFFYDTGNKMINFGNKTERKAALEIINLMGIEKALKTAAYAVKVRDEQYAPVITTPLELKNKMAKLIAFYNRQPRTFVIKNNKK